ncbi:SAM-dependent methyltransferase [Larkinella sp. VNQ87]|uniref:SAM-dependent methyltransferase n=1 Tax=Larkinella sp. VNQ87 TaxID=3400921 RepID=UPI003BFF8190
MYSLAKNKLKSALERSGFIKKNAIFPGTLEAVHAQEVAAYYDKETDSYLNTYGTIIQAARPTSDRDLIEYLSNSMDLRDGMHLLDAGCGVCGPAVEIAKTKQVSIEAITISDIQAKKAEQYVTKNQLNTRIRVRKGDYSEVDTLYAANSFDIVYFLETLGYANNLSKVLVATSKVIKQGGSIYMKEFFSVPIIDPEKKKVQKEAIDNIRKEYLYKVLELPHLITLLREAGLFVEYIRPVGVAEDFTKAAFFESVNTAHSIYTKVITSPFQIFEILELKFTKRYD